MSETVLALAPVGLVIALGWVLKRGNFPGDGFWPPLERLIFFVLFPALLIDSLATAELGALDLTALTAEPAAVCCCGGSCCAASAGASGAGDAAECDVADAFTDWELSALFLYAP